MELLSIRYRSEVGMGVNPAFSPVFGVFELYVEAGFYLFRP